jgi:hypothetical protein
VWPAWIFFRGNLIQKIFFDCERKGWSAPARLMADFEYDQQRAMP